MRTFIVKSSNPNKKGGFVTKLQAQIEVNDAIFGTKTGTLTYYISGTKQVEIGTEVSNQHIVDNFRVVEQQMVNPETGEAFVGKWLSVK